MPRVGALVVAASVALVALAAEAAPAVRRRTAQAALAFCRGPPSFAHASSWQPHPRVLPDAPRVLWHLCAQDGGFTALIVASTFGYEGCVRLLLDSKAIEVNATCRPFYFPHRLEERGLVPYLRTESGDTYHGWSALHCAAWQGHLAIVKRLLERGADPTLRDTSWGTRTALDLAQEAVFARYDAREEDRSEVVALLREPR